MAEQPKDPRGAGARVQEAQEVAQSCAACGHIRGALESEQRCARCGAEPATWTEAAVTPGPADAAEPAVGQPLPVAPLSEAQGDPANPISIAPPGTEGYDVNPELRVRY